jgi:hypothetical protein
VFIFAAPPHDCSTLLSRKNMTIGDAESGQYFYADDNGINGIKKGVIAYDYTSLFPTLTSDVRFLNYQCCDYLKSNLTKLWILGNNYIHVCVYMYFLLLYLLNSIIGCVKTIKIQQLRTNYFGVATLLDMYSGDTPTTSRF